MAYGHKGFNLGAICPRLSGNGTAWGIAMSASAFVTRGTSKPHGSSGGGGGATPNSLLEFTIILVRDQGKRPGAVSVLQLAASGRSAHGLLKWGDVTYEGRCDLGGGFVLPDGLYVLDGGRHKPGISGGGRGEHGSGMVSQQENGAGQLAGREAAGDFAISIRPEQSHGTSSLSLHADRPGVRAAGIALLGNDALLFWRRWQATPRGLRPPRLRVASGTAEGAGNGGKLPGHSGHGGGGKLPGRF